MYIERKFEGIVKVVLRVKEKKIKPTTHTHKSTQSAGQLVLKHSLLRTQYQVILMQGKWKK